MRKGYWTIQDIVAAKVLVRDIARGDMEWDAILARAKEIMEAVRSNVPADDMVLPL